MQDLANWIPDHRGLVALAVSLLTAGALAGVVVPFSGLPRLRVDPSLDAMLPEDDLGRRFYESLLERFGSDDSLVIALEDDKLFSLAGFDRVRRVTRRIEQVEGVHHVDSLATAVRLRGIDGDVEVSSFGDEQNADYPRLREELLADPLLAGTLVSRDGRATAIVVTFERMSEERFQQQALDLRVLEAAREQAPGVDVWMAGTPYVKAEITRILMSELAFMVPAILALMAALSYAFFRSVAESLIPVASVVLAMLWTLGVMGWTGHALNIVTTLIPPLVLIVGFAYAVHVVSAYGKERAREPACVNPRKLVARSLGRVGFAVFFTGLTTAAGFLSLTASSLEVIRGFGIYAVVGVAASLISSLSFVPVALALAGPTSRPERHSPGQRLDRALRWLGARSLRHRQGILIGGGLLFVSSLVASTRLEVNMEVIGNFDEHSSVRQGYEAINDLFEGANLFYVMIAASEPEAFLEPENLALVADVQEWLEQQPEIGGTTSMVDHLRVLHQAFRNGRPEERRLPETRRLTAQLLLLGANEELDDLVDRSHRTATILVRSSATSSRDFDQLGSRIDARLAELPAHLDGRATGNAMLLTRVSDAISRGQALSLLAACGMIGVILCLYFGSLRTGLVALVPNVLPVAFYFGVMGATGVTLNNATALMGSIVLGIAVDDTIHFLVHFRRAARRLGDRTRAAAEALAEVGRPVSYTTVAICLSLGIVATSALETQAHFGALGALTLAFAWAVDVVFTPALCTILRVEQRPDPALGA